MTGQSSDNGSWTRRSFLAGALGTVAVSAGCSPHPESPATIRTLRQAHPFYIAHRGGGGDWPELTAYAYEQSARLPGLHALEISVCQTSDGVLVCSHDPTTQRMTGVADVIADQTWQTLSSLMVTGRYTVNSGQPSRPFTRLADVLDAYVDNFVLFVEPKQAQAAAPLMARLAELGQPERVVWKQPVNSQWFSTAKRHGFATWGYVLNDPDHLGEHLARLAASDEIDLLGAPLSESDTFVSAVVRTADTNAKPVVMWEIRTVSDRSRALRLGADGLMTSRIKEVLAAPL